MSGFAVLGGCNDSGYVNVEEVNVEKEAYDAKQREQHCFPCELDFGRLQSDLAPDLCVWKVLRGRLYTLSKTD